MAIGQTDRQQLRYKPESNYGIIAGTGNYYNLRFASEGLKYNAVTARSKEIVASRAPRDVILVDANAEGPITGEFQYGEYDELIGAALATTPQNVIGTNGSATGTGTFTATGLTITGATPFTNAASGQWIGVANAVQTGNNKLVQITAATSTSITVASGTFTAETGTTGIVVSGARFINGSSKRSFTFERNNPDIGTTGLYEAFRGMVVDKWNHSLQPGGIIDTSFDLIGKDALAMTGATALPGTGVSSLTNRVMNAVSNVSNIIEGGAAITTTYVKRYSMQTMNNAQGLDAVGSFGNVDFRLGEFGVTVNLQLYLADATYYNKYLNNTLSSLSYRLTDAAGNAYVVTLPNGRYTTGQRPNQGRNNTQMLDLTFEVVDPSNTSQVIIIDRCGAAVVPAA